VLGTRQQVLAGQGTTVHCTTVTNSSDHYVAGRTNTIITNILHILYILFLSLLGSALSHIYTHT
jgi:hypothetical protein